MSAKGPALIAAAGGVGLGHAILPDHWVPLALVGRTRRYPLSRLARLSGLAGVAHVMVSIVLGALVILVGLGFRSAIQSAQDTIVGALLIATGVGFAAFELSGHGHSHHHHDHGHHDDHDHEQTSGSGRLRDMAAVMVPFGAAASPDLTILPVFLAAATSGVGPAVGSLVAFSAATIGTIMALTLITARGGYRIEARWLDRWGNALTALVLIAIGALILAGIL